MSVALQRIDVGFRAPSFEAPRSAVWPGLESCGLAVDDTAAVLRRLARGESLDEIRAALERGELLSKRTVHGRKHLLLAMRRRFVTGAAALPPPLALSTFLDHVEAPTARAQCLLPYLLLGDRLAWEIAALVRARRPGAKLARGEVVTALLEALECHGRRPWGASTARRWASGFLSVLREVGALGRDAQRERLLIYPARPEAFSFHLLGLYRAGLRGRALRESSLWRAMLLDEAEVQRSLRVVAERGWWRINSIGAMEEYLPVNDATASWGGNGLGVA